MLKVFSKSKSLFKNIPRYFSTQAQLIQPNVTIDKTKLFIGGDYVESVSGQTFETIDPRSGLPITSVSEGGAADIDIAVQSAREAFDNGPWPRMGGFERSKYLHKLADLLENNLEYFAQMETWDNGKPITTARGDIFGSADFIRYYAGWADKIQGKTIPMNTTFGYFDARTYHEPVGVVGAIIPWNVPMLMLTLKLAPALACGCAIVIKAAETTPLTALAFGKLVQEAGIPEGVVNIVTGYGETAGRALSSHKKVDKIAFTGETTTGMDILKCAADNLVPVTLELGGKSPAIIFADCDMDSTLDWVELGTYFNNGQVCVASTRVYVEESIKDEFIEKMSKKVSQRKIGDPFDESVVQGPQQNEQQFNKVLKYFETGKKEANCILGGNRIGDTGYFCESTIFTDVTDNMTISRDEIFGPSMQISTFNGDEDLNNIIRRANDTNYGLAAGLFSTNNEKINRVSRSLKAGTIWVNCWDIFDAGAPFGGYKHSGIGREKGEYALKNFTEVKCVVNNMQDPGTWY